jgi:TatD DNase family protein
MLTDTHCHLASRQFAGEDPAGLVARAQAAGVTRLVTLATGIDDLAANLALASRFPAVHACLGIHPCDVHTTPESYADTLAPLLGRAEVAAVGETGLDYYHPAPPGWTDASLRERQRALLRGHFILAAEAGLNVVIHTRDRTGDASLQDALAIFAEFARDVRAVFHCFPGPFSAAAPIIELGGVLSIGGVATFKNAHACLETARLCPAGTLMLETDSPYLAPVPHRGARNEPAFLCHTAAAIAVARGESLAELARHTSATAVGFFRFATRLLE